MTKISNDNRRIAKNTMFLYFRMILIMAVTLYTSRVVLNALGVVDFGVYNVVGSIVSMFAFLNTALAQATQRYITFGVDHDTIENQKKTFSMLLNVHIIIAIVLFLLCETIGVWLLYNKLIIPIERLSSAFWVMQCAILSLIITITQVPYNASIFGHEKMNAYAYISIFEVLLKLSAVLLLKFLFIDKLLAYGILTMVVSITIAMLYRIYCLRFFFNCHYVFYWSKELFKEVSSYTGWSLIGNLAWTLNSQGMNFLVNIFFGPVFNAARGIATAVESAVSSFLTNFLGATIPPIIKAYAAGDIEGMLKLHYRSSKFGFLLFMSLSLPVISILHKLLDIWLITPPPSANLFCLLSLIYIQCNSMGGTLQNIVQATGNVKNYQITRLVQLSAVPIVYVLYKLNYPVEIYLWTLIIISLLSLIVQLIVVNRQIDAFSIKVFIKQVIKPELSAYSIPLAISILCWHIDFSLIASLGIGSVVLILCLFFAWRLGMTYQERNWVSDIIRKKLSQRKV